MKCSEATVVHGRVQWLDIAKAIAIVMVVFGHTVRDGYAQLLVYGFHVPLFFVTAGMSSFYSESKKNRVKKDFIRIMIPYYVWGILSIGLYALLGSVAQDKFGIHTDLSVIKNIGGLLFGSTRNGYMQYNLPLWFLPCLFVTRLQFYLLCKVFQNKKIGVVVASAVIAAIGVAYSYLDLPYLPFSFEVSLIMLPFFVLGNWAMSQKRMWMALEGKRVAVTLCAMVLTLGAVLLAMLNKRPKYHMNFFPCFPLFLLVALMGSCGIILLSMGIQKCKFLSYLGRNTLGILVMHKYPVLIFQLVGPFEALLNAGEPLLPSALAGLVVTGIAIGACLIVSQIVMKICPFALTGEVRKNHKKI